MSKRNNVNETKSTRIGRVLGFVVEQTSAGAAVDWADLERQHADLMPELGDSLRTLRNVQSAARRVRVTARTPPESADDGGDLCLAVLRKHLLQYADFKRLRAGGQGIVYRARHRETNREVAIKVLGVTPSASPAAVERIMREAELTSRLNHPNIVTLYESGVAGGLPYCILKYIQGLQVDLHVTLNDVEPRDIAVLFVTICRAISYAHKRGVIHRDLKPSNILVDSEGQPHILDFGLAKDFGDHGSGLTQTMDFLGTLAYCSPEHLRPESDTVDVQSDVYSLGVILYELLTGTTPYPTGGGYKETIRNILEREPAPIDTVVKRRDADASDVAIDRDLAAVVLKALAKEKSERYAWADVMADDLERYLRGEAVHARAASRFYVIRKTLRRHRVAFGAAAAVLLAAIGTSIAFASMWKTSRSERDRARSAAALAYGICDTVLGEMTDSVAKLAGGAEVRDRLAGAVVRELDTLRGLVQQDEEMDALLLASHEKLGDIALARGENRSASDSFGQLVADAEARLRSRPGDRELTLALGRAHQKLGNAADDPVQHYQRSEAILRELLAARPDDAEVQHALCSTLADYAARQLRSGETAAANEIAESATAIAEGAAQATTDESWMELLARVFAIRGYALSRRGDARAEGVIEKSLDYRRQIFKRDPTDVDNRLGIVQTLVSAGNFQRELGSLDRAQVQYEQAYPHSEYLTTADPSHPEFANSYFDLLYRLARLHSDQGRFDEAGQFCTKCLALTADWAHRAPDDSDWIRRRASAVRLAGNIAAKEGDMEAAREHFEAAAEIFASILARDPADDETKRFLGMTHQFLAWLLGEHADPALPREHLVEAYRIRRQLYCSNPNDLRVLIDVVDAELAIASWQVAQAGDYHARSAADTLGRAERRIAYCAERASTEDHRRFVRELGTQLEELSASCAQRNISVDY